MEEKRRRRERKGEGEPRVGQRREDPDQVKDRGVDEVPRVGKVSQIVEEAVGRVGKADERRDGDGGGGGADDTGRGTAEARALGKVTKFRRLVSSRRFDSS
ncbi:MAG TPA: hypothetical protein VIM58_09410 [Candidatus Methylacidiphilales bacterium]